MQIIRTIEALRSLVSENRKSGKTVGFVPTMGYLHSGHLTLVDRAKADNTCIVVSIFVNPLQFGANEDLAQYPRNLDRDAALLEQAGVDILFAPSVEDMYPRPIQTIVDVPSLGGELEGEARPGHFAGVATVVSKLFNIVAPDHAYFGEKDFQQLVIIRRMVEDLAMPVCVHGVATVREADGLACSSRNSYLLPHERAAAIIVPQALEEADRLYRSGMDDPNAIEAAVRSFIASEPLASAEVVAVRDPISLKRQAILHGQSVLLALFVRIGSTRLLDNRILRREANSNVKAS